MADDDEESLPYFPSCHISSTSLPAIQMAGFGGGGTRSNRKFPDLAAAAGPWREEIDPQTRSVFYHNADTLESRWERPVDMTALSAGFNSTSSAGRVLGPENQNLSNSPPQSEKKENASLVNLVPALIRAKRRWRALVDGDTGNTYYVDDTTGISQWEKPPQEEISPSADVIGKDPATTSTTQNQEDKSLVGAVPALLRAKRKWLALVDDSTGSSYYVDEVTGTTQWEKPLEIDSAQSEEDEKKGQDPQKEATDIQKETRALTGESGKDEKQTRAASEIADSGTRGDDTLAQPEALEDGTKPKPSGAIAEVSTEDGIQVGGVDDDPFLQRADSNSTLSTYGGELESLAKYITGHSTTLDRAAGVELGLSKNGRGGGEGGGENTSETGEDTVQSTDLTHDDNSSTSESGVEHDEEIVFMPSKSSAYDSVAERGEPPFRIDGGTPSQDDSSPSEQQQPIRAGESAADGCSSNRTQSIDQHHALDGLVDDNSSQQARASPTDGDDGIYEGGSALIGHSLLEVYDARANADKQSPSVPAEPDGMEADRGTALTGEGIQEEIPRQQEQDTRSMPSLISDSDKDGEKYFKEASTKTPGSVELPSKEMIPTETPPALSDEGHVQAPPAVLSGKSNESNAMEPAEQSRDDRPLRHTSITVAATAEAKGPLPFNTATVTLMALERLKVGMQLGRQMDASVKLQAQARGWAARRACAKLVERRETRRREEREAKQRAATAIQSMVRGRAGRIKAQQAQNMRTELESQQAQRKTTQCTTSINREEPIGQRENESLDDELDVGSTVSHLRLERNNHSDGNEELEIGVSRETSVPVADDRSYSQEKGEHNTEAHEEESTLEDYDQYDSADPATTRWAEGEPQSREAEPGDPGHHEQYFGHEQGMLPSQMSEFGSTDGRFEPGPLGTIDEEGHQRNEHLWGGGGAEETEHSVEASPEDGVGPLDGTRADGVFSPAPPELARKAEAIQHLTGSSESSDDDFDEESTSGDLRDGADSDERGYGGSSRTSISSKTAETATGSATSETAASGSDGDSQLPSDGVDSYPSRDELSAKSNEEECIDLHQQPPEMTARDQAAGAAVDEYHDGSSVPADNGITGHASEEFSGSEDSAVSQTAGEGVYLDTTAPMDRLEDLRSLVAAQAQATARATMTAAGTDASKREAIKIRDLADGQAQAATSFREAVRRSIAIDNGDTENSSSITSSTSSHKETVPATPAEEAEDVGVVCDQHGVQSRQVEDEQANTRRRNTCNDGDRNSKSPDDVTRTVIDDSTVDDLADPGVSTGRAAFILASDLSRLASRQGAAACELLEVSSSEAAPKSVKLDPRKDPRKDPDVLSALAALGQAVGLQAKVVGLMEDVVLRTAHSRLDARVAARAARKEQAGRLAESLAKDVKLVAARHQHAARRMEAAPDPATARHVADDIRRLTLVQEQLAYKVQRFILSTGAALFNDNGNGQGKGANNPTGGSLRAPATTEGHGYMDEAGVSGAAVADIADTAAATKMEAETAKGRLGKLATSVVKELRKGVDVGSIAAARAQAIRRGSQAGRLADELRLIASGQVSASMALAAAGEQLVADAMAEKPLPREYTLSSSTRKRARLATGRKSGGKLPDEDNASAEDGHKRSKKTDQGYGTPTKTDGSFGIPAREPDGEREATADIGNETVGGAVPHDADPYLGEGSGLPSAHTAVHTGAARIDIEAAAGREEKAAAARIQWFLRRRRQQARPEEMRQMPVGSVSSSAVGPSSGDQRSTDSAAEWFGVALRRLRQEINRFLLGDEHQGDPATAGESKASSSQGTRNQAQELELESKSVASRLSNADDGGCTDDETSDTNDSTESSGYDDDDDWPTFPPVPPRARAPSLYTLPAPDINTWKRKTHEVDGGDSGATCSKWPTAATGGEGGVFTKLGPEVVARLSSAQSVFCLRAADVLAAFSPPPPPRSSCPVSAFTATSKVLGPRPSTALEQTVGRRDRFNHCGHDRLSSPDALRHRLRTEAEEASRAGFGRPWLLPSCKRRVPTRHKREQEQLSAFIREMNDARGARGGGMEQKREKRRRVGFFGSWTPLGRRLAKRHNAGLAARRRRVLGETDQFRARHVGRQLRSGAATNALDRVESALDLRLSVRREKRVPPAHVTELLDIVDRYVFSDSQELLEDLRQKYPVVREQSSWGDDTNPFCCDRCGESSSLPGPPEVATPLGDAHGVGEVNSSPWESDDVMYSTRNPQHPASEEAKIAETSALAAEFSRLCDDEGDQDGVAPTPSSNAVERGDRSPPAVLPTTLPESAEEDKCSVGSVRGDRVRLEVRGDGAHVDLPPTQKADDVAAAFSTHLRGVDKYPLDLARLCRFAQFLTENELLREAYEVVLHILSYFAVVANGSSSNRRAGSSPSCAASMSFSPLPLPPGLNAQLLLVAGRLAVAIGRYPEAVRHVKAAVRAATHSSSVAAGGSPAILVSSSRVFEYFLDDRSAEVIILGCVLQYPDYKPALSSYGKLAARTVRGELGVAERYLTRAASLSSGNSTAAQSAEWRKRPAEDWLALTEFYTECWPQSPRAADASACFRKALNFLDWRNLENHTRVAETTTFPCLVITGPPKTGAEPPSSTPLSSMEKAGLGKPGADTLLELGRFELLQNRSVRRALGLFKACLKESPWHASAKVHLAVCMLEQLGPVKSDRPPSRAILRTDSLLRSALKYHFDGQPEHVRATPYALSQRETPVPSPSSKSTSQRIRENRATSWPRYSTEGFCPDTPAQTENTVPSSPPGGSFTSPLLIKENNGGRGAWLLWAFYAKFAERCLRDPRLAMYALERAVAAATTSVLGGITRDRRKGASSCCSDHSDGKIKGIPLNRGTSAPSLVLVAVAQFCQRWPKLFADLAGSAAGFNGRRVSSAEEIFIETTKRLSNDPAAHAALGYFLLSNINRHDVGDPGELENLDRAIAAFRRSMVVSQASCSLFVPATRGLAVAVRRRRLSTGCTCREHQPSRRAGDAPTNNDGDSQQEEQTTGEEEGPRYLLLNALQECAGGGDDVALLRTAALHLYTWRASGNTDNDTCPTAAAVSFVVNDKAADERQAEMLLARAVGLEPFHVPTMAALAFMVLQKSGGGGSDRAMARAERLLEKAIECAGRRAPSDILRTLAQIRACRSRRSSAISLFRRAATAGSTGGSTDDSTDDPLSLCGLAQLLLAPYRRRRPLQPQASSLPLAGRNEEGGQSSNSGCGRPFEPEKGALRSPPLTASKKLPPTGASASAAEEAVPLVFPSDEEKNEAARLLARAFSSAGGAMPPENVYFGNQVDDVIGVRKCGDDDDAVGPARTGEDRDQQALAEVHLVVSGFSLKEGRGGGGSGDGAKEWHLQEAARIAPLDTKAGITSRYILGRQTLAAGDDRKAEILFLEALDAEPTTFGGCAALLSALRQVAVDVFQAKVRLRRQSRCLEKRHKGRRRGTGGVAQKKAVSARFSQKIEVSKRSVKFLERLQEYASLRKRHAGDLLRGPALANLDWALALEEDWEARYMRLLEAGDGWAAVHRLQQY